MGDFKAIKVGNKIQKNGGNVASHFLTPGGRLIHSVTGPVSAGVLLDEANWAREMYAEAQSKSDKAGLKHIAASHQQAAMSAINNKDRQVHELLSARPLPKLELVYKEVFEKILGQRVSKAGPRLAQAAERLKYAKKTGRPLLFVMHQGKEFSYPQLEPTTKHLINQYVVVVMPIREAPALSQLTGQPPFEASGSGGPVLVVAQSDCKQVRSMSGWNNHNLTKMLAAGWADVLENQPQSVATLVKARRMLRNIDPPTTNRVRELMIRARAKERAARET